MNDYLDVWTYEMRIYKYLVESIDDYKNSNVPTFLSQRFVNFFVLILFNIVVFAGRKRKLSFANQVIIFCENTDSVPSVMSR